MTEIKGDKSSSKGQELSRPASAKSDAATLPGDLPPSYSEHQEFQDREGLSAAESSQRPIPSSTQREARAEAGPTTSQPFHFPTNAIPSYAAFDPVSRPLAIPQFQPTPTSPFLAAYPTCLLSFGVPDESWRSFVDTLSAFLSAAVGTQAVQHAAELAWTLGEAHKDWAMTQKDDVLNLGRKAQRGDLFGVLGSTIGLTLGTAGHIVDSVLKFPGRLIKKPQTPRERADAYVATANKDWLNARGLHARIVDTAQLADLAGAAVKDFIDPSKQTRSVGEQFHCLQEWIADMGIGDGKDVRVKNEKKRLPITAAPPLEITAKTLWLTLLKLDEEEMMLARQS